MLLRKKRKVVTIYILVLFFSFTLIGYLIFSGKIQTEPKLISSWDTDLEELLMFGGDFATTSSDHSTFYEGKGSLRIDYDWDDTINGWDWFSLVKIFEEPQDFTPYYGISFWLKGDSSDTRCRVMLREQDGEFWMTGNSDEELFLLDSNEWQLVTIPFSQLKHDAFTPVVDGFLDLGKIKDVGLIFWDGTTQSGSIYFDELQLTPTLLPITGNNLMLMGAISAICLFTVLFFKPEIQTKLYPRKIEGAPLLEFASSVENIISEIETLFAEKKIRSVYSPTIRLELAKEKFRSGIACLRDGNSNDAFKHLSSAKRTAESLISLHAQLFTYIRYEILSINTIDNALIFFFLVSLIICAVITIFNETLANTILTYTFWLLVAGVVWKFVLLIKEEKSE